MALREAPLADERGPVVLVLGGPVAPLVEGGRPGRGVLGLVDHRDRQVDQAGMPYISVWFRRTDCAACTARPLCTRAEHQARHLKLQPR